MAAYVWERVWCMWKMLYGKSREMKQKQSNGNFPECVLVDQRMGELTFGFGHK